MSTTSEADRVWVEERCWRLMPEGEAQRCRYVEGKPLRGCGALAVAKLLRVGSRTPRGRWWAYCGEHLFGRRINGDRVEVSVHPDSLAALRGYAD